MKRVAAVGAERQQDIRWPGGSGGTSGEPDASESQREQVQRHQHPGATGKFRPDVHTSGWLNDLLTDLMNVMIKLMT